MIDVVASLESLPRAQRSDLEARLKDLVVLMHRQGWPAAEAGPFLEDLVRKMIDADPVDRAARRHLERLLRALVHVFAEQSEAALQPADGEIFRQAQEQLIEILLRYLKEELSPVDRSAVGRCSRIALLLAADYNAIVSRRQRQDLIRVLNYLSTTFPSVYADPFIVDLILIHRSMGLDRLEQVALS
jgi:hypothetical protein